MEKILSVSIAAYNVEKTLREALEPFANPAIAGDLDIMIVDDGSKDSTAAIAEEYAEKFPDTFRLISKENGGWGSTLNVGFANARGRYFKQLDGDDYFSPENLPEFLAFLKTCTADAVHSPFVTFTDLNGAVLNVYGDYQGPYRYFERQNLLPLSECTEWIPAMHSLTVRTQILRDAAIHITEKCFYTDVEFVLKSINNCNTVAFFSLPVYWYRLARSGQSMSIEGIKKHFGDHEKMLLTMLAYEKEHVTDPTKKEIFLRRLGDACNMMYGFYFAMKPTKELKRRVTAFDKTLKEEFPEYYALPQGKWISLARKRNFTPYFLFAKCKNAKDKREHRTVWADVEGER